MSFNSRVREGRDLANYNYDLTSEGFNSRVREGRDKLIGGVMSPLIVSTHASARDATYRFISCSRLGSGFNSRVREGRD